MYGLVNIAAKELITGEFGAAAWDEIRHKAHIVDDDFVGMQEYPDALTYRIIEAASDLLRVPGADLLKAFGTYWTRFVARRGYGELLEVSGNSLVEFLENLDNMHAQVGLIFPALRPPSFRVTDIGEDRLTLHYFSARQGLSPMVIGLLEGLEAHFRLSISARQVADKAAGDDHDIFEVRFSQQSGVPANGAAA
ncbi:MAG: heme NO-binding domain-containing protein [Rhodospirillaceae bacterium]|nr:heme NO-binding domain-containing protein [Rhodospirillaceae bacterium]